MRCFAGCQTLRSDVREFVTQDIDEACRLAAQRDCQLDPFPVEVSAAERHTKARVPFDRDTPEVDTPTGAHPSEFATKQIPHRAPTDRTKA